MKAQKHISTYRELRNQPLWRLLASSNGPTVIGLLQAHLYDSDRSLPASILLERLSSDLETLRSNGDVFPQTAQAYVAAWLNEGYLERSYPPGAAEEVYELSTAGIEAIRFLSNMVTPKSSATESRLSLVIQAVVDLAEDTDTDKYKRIDRLLDEQDRIDKEIEAIQSGQLRILPVETALERIREVISLAEELTGDFRRVRDKFDLLNRELREQIMDNEGNRGEVLDTLFAGIDLITESEAGRTFTAFWRLLTDPIQSAALAEALDSVLSRDFSSHLSLKERRFLLRLTRNLLDQGGGVHEVLQTFARSLKHFVQSREYLEQRRINHLIKEAQRAALDVKDEVKVTENLDYVLELTSSRLTSLAQLVLYDPSLDAPPETMKGSEEFAIDLESISALVAKSEIDFRTLKSNVRATLRQLEQASIGDVLERFPADQGLGSVVGLMALGSRHGIKGSTSETVAWVGEDAQKRRAHIPTIYFLKENRHELV